MTLSVTVGTWILNFAAAVQGGIWERAAGYTPPAMVARFQHGLISLDVIVIAVTLIAFGLGVASVWLRLGVAVRRRVHESIALAACALAVVFAASAIAPSWDWSENRMNSFAEADERALAAIRAPLEIDVHLAPEDPRRADLDRKAIAKLRRVMPAVRVRYESATSIGLFEQIGAALRRDLVRARRPEGNEPRHHCRKRARDDLRPRRRQAAGGK